MITPYEDQLAQVRSRKVVAKNNIRRAGFTLNDPADYRIFRDAQEMILRSLELEEQKLRALLHQPRRPPVKLTAKSNRVTVLTFPEFRDALLSGALKARVKHGDFTVQATRRQMAGLGEVVKRLRSLP